MDDQFDEWEAFVSAGQPGGRHSARVMFVCISTPARRPRFVKHPSGDPTEAENQLFHMEEGVLLELFSGSAPMP
jgi:hypothetical protein